MIESGSVFVRKVTIMNPVLSTGFIARRFPHFQQASARHNVWLLHLEAFAEA
jgi:hypothetical protein